MREDGFMRNKQIAAALLILCVLFAALAVPASALTWDGSSQGGGGGGSPGTTGYAIRSTDLNVVCIGYRFSVVNSSGGTKAGPIDVFRNTTGGNTAITANNVFLSKQNKRQLITNQNNGYSTGKSMTGCFYESGMSLATPLPAPSGVGTWANNITNLNRVMSWMGVGNIDNLRNGDKILVEPLWDVKLRNVYHSLTATELAIFGKWLLGVNSDGGSSTNSDTWGFISRFTNREFPNSLFTPNGQGLWTGVSAIPSTTRATFNTIINSGYGVGIGYTETRPDPPTFNPNLNVNSCQAWRGAIHTQTFRYGTSTGSAFGNFTYENGYPIMNDQIWFNLYFPPESQVITARQYVRLQGATTWTTRDVSLSGSNSSSQWFAFAPSPNTIGSGTSGYFIEAKTDHMNGSTVLKSGTVRTFYVPVRPRINRHQVTLFDVTNTQAARNGINGLSGSVYVGQKVHQQFTFTSSNTYTSTNNFGINKNGVSDFFVMNTQINSNSPVVLNSPNNPFVIPNVTSFPFELISSWSSDAGRTREPGFISIPVIRADAEVREIRLIDVASNTYVTGNTVLPGQRVTPQYVYRNNSSVRIFVEGYDNDLTRLGGSSTAIYSIPAYGEISVNGKQLTIPSSGTTFSIWGGVYLDGAGRGNTGWETNGSNNARTNTYTIASPSLTVNTLEVWGGNLGSQTFRFGTTNGAAFSNYTYANAYPVMNDQIWFNVNFPAQSTNLTVRQYIRLAGTTAWTTRDVTLSSSNTASQWFGFAPSPATVGSGTSGYTVEAKIDHMNGSTVLSSGAIKTFYVPVRPRVNRDHLTVYDVLNTQVARNGASGRSGSVYVGQKVNMWYDFSASSTWASVNTFSTFIDGTFDFVMGLSISSTSPVVRNSSRNPYVVPNLTSLPIVMETHWNTDGLRTKESRSVPITVIRADAELKEIRLIDVATNTYVTGNTLTQGQKVTPQYVYRNNTSIRIFVEGYDNDLTRLGGSSTAFYAIPANSEIAVNGKQLTVPGNATAFSVWGGVYLDGAGFGSTTWESNHLNNARTNTYTVLPSIPLNIETITPNSLYRENTEVITSFRLLNPSNTAYPTDNSVSVRFTALNGSTVLHTTTRAGVVIPANGDNLVYFKWTVPSGLNGATLTLRGEAIRGGVAVDTQTLTHGTERRQVSQTPDTQFEKAPPAGFGLVPIPTRTNQTSAQWAEWVYEDGAFVKRTYGLQLNAAAPSITPDVNAPSRSFTGGLWRMASGYGFTLSWLTPTQTLTGTAAPPSASHTAVQAADLFFPEFKYSAAVNSFRTLDRNGANNFHFPANPHAKDNARLHFTPLYYPNGGYQCQGYLYDLWTPAGMLYGFYNSNTMTITGSAFDDWFVGR
jgi:hypothetical protein